VSRLSVPAIGAKRLIGKQSQLLSDPDELRNRARLHLVHDAATVDLKSNFADGQLSGSLFIHKSAHYEGEYLPFPWSKCSQPLSQHCKRGGLPSFQPVLLERRINGRKKVYLFEGFRQKIHSAALYGLDCGRDIAVTRNKDDRGVGVLIDLHLEFNSADIWQLDIQHKT
jgi:hypothetical protein